MDWISIIAQVAPEVASLLKSRSIKRTDEAQVIMIAMLIQEQKNVNGNVRRTIENIELARQELNGKLDVLLKRS